MLFETVELTEEDCGQVVIRLQEQQKLDPSSHLVDILVCPSDPNGGRLLQSGPDGPLPSSEDAGLLYPGSYLGVSGARESPTWCPLDGMADGDGILFTGSRVRMRDLRDGSSKTLLIASGAFHGILAGGWPICGGTECEHYTSTFRGLFQGNDRDQRALQRFWSWHDSGA